MGIQAIRNSQDDTELREEIMEFLEPVTLYNPAAFSDINDNPQDALLEAAVWKVSLKGAGSASFRKRMRFARIPWMIWAV